MALVITKRSETRTVEGIRCSNSCLGPGFLLPNDTATRAKFIGFGCKCGGKFIITTDEVVYTINEVVPEI